MKVLTTLKIIFYSMMASELVIGGVIYFFHKNRILTPALFRVDKVTVAIRVIYFLSAALVVATLYLKKKLLNPDRYVHLPDESIMGAMTSSYVILGTLSETISFLSFLLYYLTGILRASLILIAISFFATASVFPYAEIVRYNLERIKQKKEGKLM